MTGNPASDRPSLVSRLLDDAHRAHEELRPHVRETALHASSSVGRERGARVLFKLESLQVTGSFKFRGALNKMLAVPPRERSRGVVTASTGNHGAAVAHAAELLEAPARVFVPESAADSKLLRIRRAGAEITAVAGDPLEAELAASEYARENDLVYVPPYNDPAVVAGQATVGLEIARQSVSAGGPDAVFVPVGGGGLAAGVAAAVKSAWPEARVIGCSPENSPAMIRAVEAGHVVDVRGLPTLSDGTAGGIEQGTITLDLCRSLVDEFLLVSELHIARCMRTLLLAEMLMVEGAAAVGLAGYEAVADRYDASATIVVVLSGANVSRQTLLTVLSDDAVTS